ncbi:MAG: CHAT domain-containing protein, partial [Cytophagaceae bacterium]|nr:CHAT domain-containing protein [Cytophagaceae bacterium]
TRNPAPEVMRRVARKEYLLTLTQDKADTWLAWAKATNNRTYLRHALATYRTADQMIDFMRWEHVGEGSKKFWREKTHRLYENAIETCHRLNQPDDAFYFFEKSRAALLADRLNELGASQLLAPTDQKREADLQKTVNDLRQKVGDLKVGDKTADSLRQKLLVEEETQTAFVRSLETRNPAYFRYRYDTSAASLQMVRQNLLTEGQTLLEYFVGDSAVYALTVTTGAAKLTRLNAPNYAQATRQFLTLTADAAALNQHFPDFLKTSHQLFQQLFAPLGVPKGRVIVSPDGVLLPLELLSRSPTDPDYLLRDYAFSYTYSAQFLLKQASRKPLVSGSFLGMAPVAFAGGQPTLGGSDASLNAVATGFFSPTLLLGSAATKRAFLRELPRHRVAQLYAHAQADSSGQEPEIFFADSSLRASELSGLGLLPTQLVVLSACQTGVGQTTRGEGVFSLARSLALAGVPSTVTTLWRVDNVATYRLTELFFEKIGDELPADEALQQAKLAYLVAAPGNRQLPPFWAGMVLIGSAAPVEQGTSLWIWAGGGVALLGLGVWGWRQKKAPPRWLS